MNNPDMKKLLINKEDHQDFKEIAQKRGMKMYSLFYEMLNDYKYKEMLGLVVHP